MAYIDVMSAAAYGQYNRKLARLAGLQAAVYWEELTSIAKSLTEDKAFDFDGCFKVDRKRIENRTGLSKGAQKDAEAVLAKLKVLVVHPADPDRIGLMCEAMFELLSEVEPKKEKKVAKSAKLTREEKSEDKKGRIIAMLKSKVEEPDQELREAYCRWIESAYDKGMCKSAQVQVFVSQVRSYSKDKRTQLGVIDKCTLLSYRDASWGIQRYEEGLRLSPTRLGEQKIAHSLADVDTSHAF